MEDTTNTKLSFKYVIISAGCSYAIHLEQTKMIAKKFNSTPSNFLKKCEVIFLGATSSSIQYTKESIIQLTQWLIDNGISNENIFVVSNLTQFGRMNFKIDDSFVEEIVEIFESNQIERPIFFSDIPGFKIIQYPRGYFYLNGSMYSSLVDNSSEFKKISKSLNNSILEYHEEYYKTDTIGHMVEYINNLIQIQKFLKENKIDYRFYFMNDIFEGWYYDNEILTHAYNKNIGKFEIPNLKKYGNISELDNRIKNVFSLIDFDNIISYKTDKFNYGGVDEYLISKFNFTDFISTNHFKTEDDYKNFNFIGQHPDLIVTTSFEKNFILPELQPFLNKFI